MHSTQSLEFQQCGSLSEDCSILLLTSQMPRKSPVRDQMAASLETQLRPFLRSYTFYTPCTQFRYSILHLHDIPVPTNPEDPCRCRDTFLYPVALAQRLPPRRPEWTDVHSRFLSMWNETLTDPFKEGKTTWNQQNYWFLFFPVRYGLYE